MECCNRTSFHPFRPGIVKALGKRPSHPGRRQQWSWIGGEPWDRGYDLLPCAQFVGTWLGRTGITAGNVWTDNCERRAPKKKKARRPKPPRFQTVIRYPFLIRRTCCRRFPGPGRRCRHCRILHPHTSRSKCCRPIRRWRPSRWHRRNPGTH